MHPWNCRQSHKSLHIWVVWGPKMGPFGGEIRSILPRKKQKKCVGGLPGNSRGLQNPYVCIIWYCARSSFFKSPSTRYIWCKTLFEYTLVQWNEAWSMFVMVLRLWELFLSTTGLEDFGSSHHGCTCEKLSFLKKWWRLHCLAWGNKLKTLPVKF